MKLKYGEVTQIANKTGYSKSMISHVMRREKRAPLDFAEYMESKYGIDRRSWYWPETYPNPFWNDRGKDVVNQ
jgi:hypothetical protein